MPGGNCVFRIAETREDLEGAMRLVYHNYVEQGYCRLDHFRMHFYLYDMLPETRTLVAVADGEVIATVTLVFDSPLGMPSDGLYKKELDVLRAQGRRLMEISKLAADRDSGKRRMDPLLNLCRLLWLIADRIRGASDMCIMVEPHHGSFYEKKYLFERIGDLRPDPKAGGAPSTLLRLDLVGVAERYRRAFGERFRRTNTYWFHCLDPAARALEEESRAADERLARLHARIETGKPLVSPSVSERRYVDFRLFGIALNTNRICDEARERSASGQFREEVEQYERLLAVLPSGYAPERRARILLQLGRAAWYCGLYERTLSLCAAARGLALDADLKSSSYQLAAVAMHFLGRREEAREMIREGLAFPGSSPLSRSKLLRNDGRMAIDDGDLERARARLTESRAELAKADENLSSHKARALLAHDLHIVARRSGDMLAARAVLREAVPCFEKVGGQSLLHYHEALTGLEMMMGRPRKALVHAELALEAILPDSNFFNAAVVLDKRGKAFIALGEMEAAGRAVDQALDMARRSRQPRIIAEAAMLSARLHLVEDDLAAAGDVLAECEALVTEKGSPWARAQLAEGKALLAAAGNRWDDARALYAAAEEDVKAEPAFSAELRCSRVETELLAGDLSVARELAEDLRDPERMPGYATYAARWWSLRAVFLATEGDEPGALAALEEAVATALAGEAWVSLALDTCVVALGTAACGVAERCPDLISRCRELLGQATGHAKLPYFARRLAEPPLAPGSA